MAKDPLSDLKDKKWLHAVLLHQSCKCRLGKFKPTKKQTKRKNQETTGRHWECKQKDSTIMFSTDM
jgi:hypothetical protein